MLDSNAIHMVRKIINASDFSLMKHQNIFGAAEWLNSKGRAVDAVNLVDAMRDLGTLDKVGGALAIAQLAESVPTASDIAYYVNIIHNNSNIDDRPPKHP